MTQDPHTEAAGEFFYDVRTGQVSRGRTTGWSERMGPYPTRDAAEHALEQARDRTRAWDEDDAARD